MRKIILVAAALAALPLLSPAPAQARQYRWCAYYSGRNESTNCGFDTYAQCRATISGVGGSCGQNPAYGGYRQRHWRHRY